MFEDGVVHFPEAAMGGGKFGGFCCGFGVGVCFVEGEVAEDEGEFFAEVFLDALDDGIGVAAVGALIVAVFDEEDGGGEVALDVVCGGNRDFEHGDSFFYFGSSSRAWRMPSAPGLMPMGER